MRDEDTFWVGVIIGVAITIFLWLLVASLTEQSKVRTGYLTYHNKTYKVTLHDTLEAPEKDTK